MYVGVLSKISVAQCHSNLIYNTNIMKYSILLNTVERINILSVFCLK
jgi:hypothetical protein